MPIIVYQSLNSNSSSDHGVASTSSQYFTTMTQKHLVTTEEKRPFALTYPTVRDVPPHEPVEGPAHLEPMDTSGFTAKGSMSSSQSLYLIEEKARQNHQIAHRAYAGPCDLMVFGELDSSNPEWRTMISHAGPALPVPPSTKACQCFSAHSQNSGVRLIASGDSWIAALCANVIVVFVHVPNAIASRKPELSVFYRDIRAAVMATGLGAIDLVMGDTNQKSQGFTPDVLTSALGSKFSDAHPDKIIEVFDTYHRTVSGTNAKGTAKYDVAIYNTTTVATSPKVSYMSQTVSAGTGVAAVTDHMGITVNISK